jgi:spore maturation protein CgeB
MLWGSGAILSKEQYQICIDNKIPIISIGLSDPNLYNVTHYNQGNIYLTNDLTMSKRVLSFPSNPVYFYNTTINQNYHKNLNFPKENDILVYGCGNHKFVTNRNKIINQLRKDGFKVKVFGRDWAKHSDTFPFIEGQQLIQEINKAHIVLDISNKTTAWPRRIMEASACGTPVVTMEREDTLQFFERDTEIIVYNTYEELVTKLKVGLNNTDILRQIGLAANKRCYQEHDISIRIQQLDKIIKEVINGK